MKEIKHQVTSCKIDQTLGGVCRINPYSYVRALCMLIYSHTHSLICVCKCNLSKKYSFHLPGLLETFHFGLFRGEGGARSLYDCIPKTKTNEERDRGVKSNKQLN